MAILIENLQNRIAVTDNVSGLIKRSVELALKLESFTREVEVSVLLVDDDKIRDMNREFRNKDAATDVLSFPMLEIVNGEVISDTGDMDMDENLLLLGDIVISMERVLKQSKEYVHTFERELAFLVTHGVFHLLGYDHENEDDEKYMLGKQEAVLQNMGLKRQMPTDN